MRHESELATQAVCVCVGGGGRACTRDEGVRFLLCQVVRSACVMKYTSMGVRFMGEGLPTPYDRHGKTAESVVVTCSAFMELFNLARAQLYVKGCGTP